MEQEPHVEMTCKNTAPPNHSLVRLAFLKFSRLQWQLVLLGAILLALIWSAVLWEVDRIRQERMTNFRLDLMHLTEVLDETLVRQVHEIDNALRLLRAEYVDDKQHLMHAVQLLRQGPLKELDVHVAIIGHDGYPEMSDVPGSHSAVYFGDRPHFRFFADGGPDQLYISEPVLGRVTKRWGMQLVRPILGHDGKFLGIVVIFLPPAELTRFIKPMELGADTVMSVLSPGGAVLSRSKDLDKFLDTRLSPGQMTEFQRNRIGFTLRRSVLDQVERGMAHRWLSDYPLLMVVSRTPNAVYAEIATSRRLLMALGGGLSLLVMASLAMLARSMRQRKQAEEKLQQQHTHLVEAQQIAKLGSWDHDLASGKRSWSDQAFHIFEIDRNKSDPSYKAFLDAVHPDDRDVVDRAYADALKKSQPYDISYRLRMGDGRIKWVHARGNLSFDAQGQPIRLAGTLQDITERKQEESEREALSRERVLLLESTGEGIYGINLQGICTFINKAAAGMLGYEVPEIIGKNIHELVHHQHDDGSPYPLADCPVYLASISGQPCKVDNEVFWRKDGTPVPVEYAAYPIHDRDSITGTVTTFSDITQRKHAEMELRIAEKAFQTQEGMMVTDGRGTILRVNDAFTNVTGYTAAEALGKNPRFRSSGRHDADFYAAMWQSIRSTGTWKGDIWNRRKNGDIYPESVTITAVTGNDTTVTHYVATMHEISERKAAEEQIHNLAFFDPLTGLANRRLLQDRLQQALVTSARSKRHGALLFLDLDKFKTLNDTLGHDIGDLLLQQVAQRLLGCIREADTVARPGGDEFVLMLEDLSENRQEAITQATSIGEKILSTLNQTYQLGEHAHHSTPSIGATLFNGQQNTAEELVKQADLAMYQVKAAGRNALRFFDPATQTTGTDAQGAQENADQSKSTPM
jgi:diguanylate cyclase (GGDEF)-like protein/PAS domain S-box-containing protein